MDAEPMPSTGRAVTVSFPKSYVVNGFGLRSCATRPIRDLSTADRRTRVKARLMVLQQIIHLNCRHVIYQSEPHHSEGQLKLSAPWLSRVIKSSSARSGNSIRHSGSRPDNSRDSGVSSTPVIISPCGNSGNST